MDKLFLVHDIFNNRWLQFSEDGELQWTDISAYASFFEPSRKDGLLADIKHFTDEEVWIEFREIYVNLNEQQPDISNAKERNGLDAGLPEPNRYGKTGFHTPEATSNLCKMLQDAGIAYRDESCHNDELDRVTIIHNGKDVYQIWVGNVAYHDYRQNALDKLTDKDSEEVLRDVGLDQIIDYLLGITGAWYKNPE